MKPLWPDSNEILGEKDSEENKSTEQDQVLSILIKSFGFYFCIGYTVVYFCQKKTTISLNFVRAVFCLSALVSVICCLSESVSLYNSLSYEAAILDEYFGNFPVRKDQVCF